MAAGTGSACSSRSCVRSAGGDGHSGCLSPGSTSSRSTTSGEHARWKQQQQHRELVLVMPGGVLMPDDWQADAIRAPVHCAFRSARRHVAVLVWCRELQEQHHRELWHGRHGGGHHQLQGNSRRCRQQQQRWDARAEAPAGRLPWSSACACPTGVPAAAGSAGPKPSTAPLSSAQHNSALASGGQHSSNTATLGLKRFGEGAAATAAAGS